MKIKNILTFFLFTIAFLAMAPSLFSQSSINIDGKKIPYPTISKIIEWVDCGTKEWKSEMQKYDFSDSGISEEGANYVKVRLFLNNRLSNTFLFEKFIGKQIQISYSCYDRKPIFDDFIDELSDYYIERHENMVEYRFTNDSHLYRVFIMRTPTLEIIRVIKE